MKTGRKPSYAWGYVNAFWGSKDYLISLRGDVNITTDVTIASYLHKIIIGKESSDDLSDIIHKCDSVKLRLLWDIFFETGIHDVQLLEERIYAFGGELKEKDLLGREVFLVLVSILHHIKSQ